MGIPVVEGGQGVSVQPFPLRGPGFVHAGAISPGRDGFSRSQAGSGDCWGVAVGAGAAFATQGNGANRGEPAQLHADVGRGCLWGAEGRVLPVLCPGSCVISVFLQAVCPCIAAVPVGAAQPWLLSCLLLLRCRVLVVLRGCRASSAALGVFGVKPKRCLLVASSASWSRFVLRF